MTITENLETILGARYGRDVRQAIHDGIKQAYEDAISNGHADMEVSQARGSYPTLGVRLDEVDNKQRQTDEQLAQKANKEELSNILDGSPKGTYATLADLQTAYPTGTTGIFVLTNEVGLEGHWVYWNGTSWTDGGVYQAVELEDESVTPKKTKNTLTSAPMFFGNQPVVFDLNNKTATFPTTTALLFRNIRYQIAPSSAVKISIIGDGSDYQILFYNPKTNSFSVKSSGTLTSYTATDQDNITVALIDYFSKDVYVLGKVNIIGKPTIGIEKISQSVSNGAVIHGDNPVKFDLTKKSIQIISNTFITYRNTRYLLPNKTISLLDPSISKHQMMFYDFDINDYVIVSSSNLPTTSEKLIFIAAIDLQNFKVYAQGNYTVNSVFERVKTYQFSPEEILGDYTPISPKAVDGSVGSDFNATTIMAQDVYDAFDALMTTDSNYITRQTIGYDVAGTLPIYAYEWNPEQSQKSYITGSYKKLPKIIIGAGIHGNGQTDAGDRETTVLSLYYFFKDICENWTQDRVLEYLRWNVRFVVVPIQNPWGFNNRSRRNENQVDLSRNYDYLWSPTIGGNIGDNTYSGSSAFSESESIAMRDLILANSDALHLIDLHCRGGSPTDDQLIMFDMTKNNEMYYSAEYHISRLSRIWSSRSYGLTPLTHYGTIYDSITPAGKVHGWGTHVAGIPSVVLEGFANNSTGAFTTNNLDIVKMNMELIGNWIWYTLKYFKNK